MSGFEVTPDLSAYPVADTTAAGKSCPDCLSIFNRLWYGGALSPSEQACCQGAEKAQIQTVPDNLEAHYSDTVTAAQQSTVQGFATGQENLAASDVTALSNQSCPWSILGNCYASLTDVFSAFVKYALIGVILVIIVYGLVAAGGARTAYRRVAG